METSKPNVRTAKRRVVVWGVWAAVFLLIGAAVNVAVAWGIVFVQKPQFNTARLGETVCERIDRGETDDWLVVVNQKVGYDYAFAVKRVPWDPVQERWLNSLESTFASQAKPGGFVPPPRWAIEITRTGPGESRRTNLREGFASGLPRRATHVHFRTEVPLTSPLLVIGGIMIEPDAMGSPLAPPRTLPLAPLWPGFLINTVFYGAIAWMLFFAPRAGRRHRRAKRGVCAFCAYDLRGADHGKCPECGEPVKGVAG